MIRIIILLSGLGLSLLTYSGFAEELNLNDYLLYGSWGCLLYYFATFSKNKSLEIGRFSYVVSIFCLIILANVVYNYENIGQLLNYTTLFGLIIGTNLLSRIKWNKSNSLLTGIILCISSCILMALFIKGGPLSGWNSNSIIGLVPAAMCGLGFIYLSDKPIKTILFYGLLGAFIIMAITLKNRSSLLSFILLGILSLPIVFKSIYSITLFRIYYIALLIINITFPIFNELIGSLDIYNDMMTLSQEYVDKTGGFSERDGLWRYALTMLSDNPLLGNGGIRPIYFHNFSCDVLTQFGWLGWITFAIMYVTLMERCHSIFGRSNFFLLSFGSLLLLNTFENALFANGYFTIYPYLLFAISYQLKSNRQ